MNPEETDNKMNHYETLPDNTLFSMMNKTSQPRESGTEGTSGHRESRAWTHPTTDVENDTPASRPLSGQNGDGQQASLKDPYGHRN